MNLGGFPWPFVGRSWRETLDEYHEHADWPTLAPLRSVLESVVDNQMEDRLALKTSMWDLLITSAPPSGPPVDIIVVRQPERRDEITIEHWATSGKTERITRPADEVLPLFWRFVLEKYGIKTA